MWLKLLQTIILTHYPAFYAPLKLKDTNYIRPLTPGSLAGHHTSSLDPIWLKLYTVISYTLMSYRPCFAESEDGSALQSRHHRNQRMEVVQLQQFLGTNTEKLVVIVGGGGFSWIGYLYWAFAPRFKRREMKTSWKVESSHEWTN